MNGWLVISTIAVGTYLMRASMFIAFGDRDLPAWVERPMALVAPAAVAALVSSSLMVDDGAIALPAAPEILAILAGFIAVRRTGNVMHAFAAGLPVFWLLSAVVG
jgi:branched-subunit amino acid transport protein